MVSLKSFRALHFNLIRTCLKWLGCPDIPCRGSITPLHLFRNNILFDRLVIPRTPDHIEIDIFNMSISGGLAITKCKYKRRGRCGQASRAFEGSAAHKMNEKSMLILGGGVIWRSIIMTINRGRCRQASRAFEGFAGHRNLLSMFASGGKIMGRKAKKLKKFRERNHFAVSAFYSDNYT